MCACGAAGKIRAMPAPAFVHLRLHSEYSVVDGSLRIDDAAAAVVRTHANGNETVPTVVVGDVGLVNPSASQLIGFLAEHAPHLLPDGIDIPQPGKVGRFVDRILRS